MSKHVEITKSLRLELDDILQKLRFVSLFPVASDTASRGYDPATQRASRERSLAITKLQEAIMWLGMDLKGLKEAGLSDEPNPYPTSYDPSVPSVEPTARALNSDFMAESPKSTNLTFGEAIEALKQGRRVTRPGWNGRGMYLWLLPAGVVKAEWCREEHLKAVAEANGGSIPCLAAIRMMTADHQVLTGWLASQTDILAEDWQILPD